LEAFRKEAGDLQEVEFETSRYKVWEPPGRRFGDPEEGGLEVSWL
jgi:hypothetical protein